MNSEETQGTLGTAMMKSLASEKLSELTLEFTEIAIDSFLVEGVAKNLPFYQVYKLVTSVRDLALMKKTYAFLFEHRNVPLSDRVKFLSQFETEKDIREFGELVIALLDRVIQIDKAKIIAKLSMAEIRGTIDRATFLLLAEMTARLYLQDLKYLQLAYENPVLTQEKKITYDEPKDLAYERLANVGLMSLVSRGTFLARVKLSADINPLGKIFVEIILKDEHF
jgi:hypothetical protein